MTSQISGYTEFDTASDAVLALLRGFAEKCRYEDYTDTEMVWHVLNGVHMLLDNGRTIDQFFIDYAQAIAEANNHEDDCQKARGENGWGSVDTSTESEGD